MILEPLAISGAYRVRPEPIGDARGHFARCFDAAAFAAQGLVSQFAQHSLSHNLQRGTLRGLHYQAAPHGETKLVRCVRGAVFDVVVDVRDGSPTCGHWVGETLSADNALALYIPVGCAHGFISLADHCDLYYLIDTPHQPAAGRIIRWDDPQLAIDWPLAPTVMSPRDAAAGPFNCDTF